MLVGKRFIIADWVDSESLGPAAGLEAVPSLSTCPIMKSLEQHPKAVILGGAVE